MISTAYTFFDKICMLIKFFIIFLTLKWNPKKNQFNIVKKKNGRPQSQSTPLENGLDWRNSKGVDGLNSKGMDIIVGSHCTYYVFFLSAIASERF